MKKLTAIALSLLLCMGLFTACKTDEPSNSGLSGNREDIPQMDYNYLTGMPFKDGQDKNARPIAVMINNVRVALPQYGLESADIIYEAVTEGGITRLMALYSDIENISKVGPVRSARDQFVEMMLPLNAIYVHIGSSTSARRMLNFYSYQDIDGIYLGFISFEYDAELAKTKSREHCWFTTKDLIKAGIRQNNIGTKNSFYPAFDFIEYGKGERIPAVGDAGSIVFEYSNYADVAFNYDENTGKYLKSAFGVPHTDAATGNTLSFDNVFIIVADVGIQEENGILPDFDLSAGTGYYFYKGKYEQITWTKGSPENPLLIYGKDGEILKVNPGKSYVGLLDRAQLDTLVISRRTQESVSAERVQ